LIRTTNSKPGSFAIAYSENNQNRIDIIHIPLTNLPGNGYRIEEAYNKNARGKVFANLQEIIVYLGDKLQHFLTSNLTNHNNFFGELGSDEAEELLKGSPPLTYLFRFSSKAGFLAVSYVLGDKKGINAPVKHGLLEITEGGYKYDNQPPILKTLADVVNNLPDLLQKPLICPTLDKKTSEPSQYQKLVSVEEPSQYQKVIIPSNNDE